jgi:ribosomal-protein-alanine N-acetyltransferase
VKPVEAQIVIEKARESDRPRIMELLRQANMGEIPCAEISGLAYENYFVARAGGGVVGFCGYRMTSEREAKTELMVVDRAWRRRGIGSRLQTQRMWDMRRRGARTVTTNADRPETVAWYKSHFGYREVGRLEKQHKFGDPDIGHWTTLCSDLVEWEQTQQRREGGP